MGMRRLSIIDLSGGHQPMCTAAGSVWVVFNGEIYNFREIRSELVATGHRFQTNSDTEVLVHGYEEHGEDFVDRLNGMFGFALWDDKRKRLILGRDRMGVKPLYYYLGNEMLAFASEVKALTALESVPREVDPLALDEFMTLEYTLAPRTLLKNVHKLQPGHLLVVEGSRVCEKRYWKPRIRSIVTEAEACAALRTELRAAVERRLISDVPLGAFLSGGIDSSIIVGLMAEIQDRPVQTFSIGFDDKSYNELDYARRVARRFGTDHFDMVLKPDPVGFLDDFQAYLDEPIGDVSIFPTFLVSQVARRKVTVVLSGDGGDELFGGYDWYAAQRLAGWYQGALPTPVRSALGRLAAALPPAEKKKGPINKLKRFTEGFELPEDLEHYRWICFLTDDTRRRLYSPDLLASLPDGNAFARLRDRFGEAREYEGLNRNIWVDLNVYLPEDILVKVDLASMANSLEARTPFLDYRVVELALSIPGSMKLKGSRRKHVLKEAFADLLPREIIERKKEGFSIPMKNWLRAELREAMHDLLNASTIGPLGLFHWSEIERMIAEHERGIQNHAHRLWCLMVFVLWHRKFIQKSSGGSDTCRAH